MSNYEINNLNVCVSNNKAKTRKHKQETGLKRSPTGNTCVSDHQPETLGSSRARKLTAGYSEPEPTHYKVKQYCNGETVFIAYKKGNPETLTPGRSESESLNDKARTKIKRSARFIQREYGKCSFATLTYGQTIPDDKQAKRHLDNFIKQLRRIIADIEYLWVAELQPQRDVLHFHVLFNQRIHYSIINACWNSVVNRWAKRNGLERQVLYPNIKALHKPARYMAKYMSKDSGQIQGNYYDMSKGVRQLIQPVAEYETTVRGPEHEILKNAKKLLDEHGINYLSLEDKKQEIALTNIGFYDHLETDQVFEFGLFIPQQDTQIDLITLLIQAIYPSSKIHQAA